MAALAAVLALAACATPNKPESNVSVQELLGQGQAAAAPATIELVENAIEEGRLMDARRLLDRLRLAEPENPRQQLAQAELALASGTFKQAQDRFAFLVGNPVVGARADQGLGIALLLQGQRPLAYETLIRAVTADPGLARAWNALGYYYDAEQRFEEAAAAYGKAIAASPSYALAYNNRGYSLLMQRRIDEAMKDFERALALEPKLTLARQNMRLAYAWRGDYAAALVGVASKEMGRALNNVGYIALMRGDHAAAETYFLRAMEADPAYNQIAARNLAYVRSLKGQPVPAAAQRP